jgi:hypothetical protein
MEPGRSYPGAPIVDALKYILGHNGVWLTDADEIAQCPIANYGEEVTDW